MDFIQKIRSCFGQDDLGAPTQHGVAVDGKNLNKNHFLK